MPAHGHDSVTDGCGLRGVAASAMSNCCMSLRSASVPKSFLAGIYAAGELSFVAVDRASWYIPVGIRLPPAYLKINVVREYFPDIPLLPLTASGQLRKWWADIADSYACAPRLRSRSVSRDRTYPIWCATPEQKKNAYACSPQHSPALR